MHGPIRLGIGLPAQPRSHAYRRSRLSWLGAAAGLSALVWVVFLRGVVPMDFHSFYAGGHAVAQHRSPYPELGTPAVWSGSAFVYPWVSAWVFVPFTVLAPTAAAVLMATVSAAAIGFGVWAIRGWDLGAFAAVLLASPTLAGLQLGTIDALLFCGACAAWRWRSRPACVGLAVGLLITLKMFCWPLLAWLVLGRRFRAAGRASATVLGLLALGWSLGPIGPFGFARLLSQLSAHELPHTSGLQGVLTRAGLGTAVAELVGLACAAVVVLVGSRRGEAMTFSSSVLAALLASPIVGHHYYLLAAAPLLLARRGPLWFLVLGWASASAHGSHGVSWVWLTVSTDIALAAVGIRMAWLRVSGVGARARRLGRRLAVALIGLVAGAVAALAIPGVGHWLLHALGPSGVSVTACVATYVVALHRMSGARQRMSGALHRMSGALRRTNMGLRRTSTVRSGSRTDTDTAANRREIPVLHRV